MKPMLFVAGLLMAVTAHAENKGAELFQQAVTQERAAGNLDQAIQLYQRVAKEFALDRALAARALLSEAQCYEKLGQGDSVRQIYAQVAREYKDQTSLAAIAGVRLAAFQKASATLPALSAQSSMKQTRIDWGGGGSAFAVYNTDGHRYLSSNNQTGELSMTDIGAGDRRVFYKLTERRVNVLFGSRDLSLVLLSLIRPDESETWAVVKTDGSGFRELPGNWRESWWFSPEISWDNTFFLIPKADKLLQVSTTDLTIHELGKIGGAELRLSPDDKYISYAAGGGIYVAPLIGGTPVPVSDKGFSGDWTRDGKNLLISTLDSATDGLYAVPVKDGQKAGDPVLLRYGAFAPYNPFYSMGRTTSTGVFIYQSTPTSGQYSTWIGRLESGAASLKWQKLPLAGSNSQQRMPAWSPDSSQVAYVAYDHAAGQLDVGAVRVLTLATGNDRGVYRGQVGQSCSWTSGTNLICAPSKGHGWLSISTTNGATEEVAEFPAQLLPRQQDQSRWHLDFQPGKIMVQASSGGDWRLLAKTTGDLVLSTLSPDGDWLYFRGNDASGKPGLYRAALVGGDPLRIGDAPGTSNRGRMSFSPDGGSILAETQDPLQLWMLENFGPK